MLIVDWCLTGKTELAKQVARYLHKDNKKVNVIINNCIRNKTELSQAEWFSSFWL